MQKYRKILILATAVFLLATACNQNAGSKNQELGIKENQQTQNNQQAQEINPSRQTQVRQNASGSDYTPGVMTVTQTVEGSNLNKPSYGFTQGQTALDILQASHKVETKDYGSMGQFVVSIDGVKTDSRHFWEFFVNGKSSNVGASGYKLQADDKIEWKLSELK